MNLNQRTSRLRLSAGFMILILFFLTSTGLAEEKEEALSYEIQPLLTAEQTDRGLDYFYFKAEPNETKTVSFDILNHGDQTAQFIVQLNRATTNQNGFLDYSLTKQQASDKLDVDFNQIVPYRETEVEVGANQKKTVTFSLTLPEKEFKGIILGGIYVTKKIEDADKQTSSAEKQSSMTITNQLAYATAIMIQEQVPYQDGHELLLNSVAPKPVDHQGTLVLNLANRNPNLLNNLNLKTEIYNRQTNALVTTLTKENLSFAPNSLFDLAIPWDQQEMLAGKYLAKVTAESGDNNWHFEKEFDITKDTVKELATHGDPIRQPEKEPVLLYVLLGILIITMITGIIIFIKKNNQTKTST